MVTKPGATGARFEITIDGKPRGYRDTETIAVEAARLSQIQESECRSRRPGFRVRHDYRHQEPLIPIQNWNGIWAESDVVAVCTANRRQREAIRSSGAVKRPIPVRLRQRRGTIAR